MKLGFFVTNQYLPGESMPEKIQDSAEQVRAARDAGFSLIATGQHYLAAPYQMSTVFPLLSRLAAEAGDMQVAATVILVPLHNPVELAESIATLDCITNGKFVFGVGLGYRDEEYTAFGIQRSERVGRMNEAMDLIKRLWSEDEVEFNGKYYTVPKTKISTRPVQAPHPPIWVAANNDVAQRGQRQPDLSPPSRQHGGNPGQRYAGGGQLRFREGEIMKLQYVALFVGMLVVASDAVAQDKDDKRSEAEQKAIAAIEKLGGFGRIVMRRGEPGEEKNGMLRVLPVRLQLVSVCVWLQGHTLRSRADACSVNLGHQAHRPHLANGLEE